MHAFRPPGGVAQPQAGATSTKEILEASSPFSYDLNRQIPVFTPTKTAAISQGPPRSEALLFLEQNANL